MSMQYRKNRIQAKLESKGGSEQQVATPVIQDKPIVEEAKVEKPKAKRQAKK